METWNIIGNQWAVSLLQNHISQNSLQHAYLITGPDGVGRRTLALAFTKALNCQSPPEPGQFCNTCRSCKLIEKMQHPDLTIIQRGEDKRNILVDQIRELQRTLSYAPYESSYKTALLLNFEDAHDSASNALLKTLEEPPSRVVLILTASTDEALLPTIISRCEVIRLHSVPLKEIDNALSITLDHRRAALLSHISGGRPGYAIHLIDHLETLERREQWLEDFNQLLASDRVDRFSYFEKSSFKGNLNRQEQNNEFTEMLNVWVSYLRDVLLRAAGASSPLENVDRENEINQLAKKIPVQTIRKSLLAMNKTIDNVDKNVNLRLCAEVLMLNLPYIH
ncbi:MAG: hypothetical protein JXA19_06955 [Anaerolineales bacterium]|nr:hypothetical protein [Anaerolineales bacterium]